MKKLIIACTLFLVAGSVFGDSKREKDHKKSESGYHSSHHPHSNHNSHHGRKHKPSLFDVVPLNSPVRESIAKFLLKTPKDFEIDQVMFKVKNANELFIKEKDYSPTNLVSGPGGKELHIPISSLKNGFYRLFVRIRTVEKVKPKYRYHDHDFKSSYHNFVKFVIEKKSGVQMPDPVKNDATVAGVDSDNDGIRDDIQLWIESKYPVSSNVKKGLQQQARARQLNLVNAVNKENSIISTRSYLNSSTCLAAILGGSEQMKLTNELNKRLINTKDRIYAELNASSNFSGQVYSLAVTLEEEKSLCDFELQ
ncbi:hypothetical protein ACJVC5_14035 [Peredibacter sp. HCB2-198]|uniref:hypothetical protein n=1 Tax=Peredibacter sp. HCB2-198 TaxID=3383025 RepID=UPI0038B667C9